MQTEASILTAVLCVAIVLTLSGCASAPAAGVKHAIEKRLKAQEAAQAACPNPVNITIINGDSVPTVSKDISNGVPND